MQKKPLEWSEPALFELEDTLGHIAEENVANALLVADRIDLGTLLIAENPKIGKPGLVANTRELVVPHTRYTLIYQEETTRILILHCWHQSRAR